NKIVPSIGWDRENFIHLNNTIGIPVDYYESLDKQVKNKNYIKIWNTKSQDYTIYKKSAIDESYQYFFPINKNRDLQNFFNLDKDTNKNIAEELTNNELAKSMTNFFKNKYRIKG